jgi:sulfate adenylyltransferase subunit 1
VLRPGADGSRRYAGTLASGVLQPGATVRILPASRATTVKEIATFDGPRATAAAGDAITVRLGDEIDISRGDMLVEADRPPRTTRAIDAQICWFVPDSLQLAGRYLLKHTTSTVKARINSVNHRLDIHTLERAPVADRIGMNDIAHISLSLNQPLFCDAYRDNRATGSFILIDELTHQTVAAGLIE